MAKLHKTDEFDRAEMGKLVKAGALKPGTHSVLHRRKNGAEYRIGVEAGKKLLLTFPGGESINTRLVYTEVGLGKRPNFICPMCKNPRLQLYPQGGCRKCCKLGFKQKKQKKWPSAASMKTSEQIEALCGWDSSVALCPKPVGMSKSKQLQFVARLNVLLNEEAAARQQTAPILAEQKRLREYYEREEREQRSAMGNGIQPDIVHNVLGF